MLKAAIRGKFCEHMWERFQSGLQVKRGASKTIPHEKLFKKEEEEEEEAGMHACMQTI